MKKILTLALILAATPAFADDSALCPKEKRSDLPCSVMHGRVRIYGNGKPYLESMDQRQSFSVLRKQGSSEYYWPANMSKVIASRKAAVGDYNICYNSDQSICINRAENVVIK